MIRMPGGYSPIRRQTQPPDGGEFGLAHDGRIHYIIPDEDPTRSGRNFVKFWTIVIVCVAWQITAMAVEEVNFVVLERAGSCELRQYESAIVAETIVTGDFSDAGNQAFNRLFRYISGNNRTRLAQATSAPVEPTAPSAKIAMTAPVGQERVTNGWSVTFMMPAAFKLEMLPEPKDPAVRLRQVPGRLMAGIAYSGRWTRELYDENAQRLHAWIAKRQLKIIGEEVWARYNPPFMPSFFRRNEILIPVERVN